MPITTEGLAINIDFSNHPGFSAYVLLLAFSGFVSLFLSSNVIGRTSRGLRILNLVFGVGFIGYAFYLAFLFHGGTYIIFFKAFIVPAVLAIQTIRASIAQRRSGPSAPRVLPGPPVGYPAGAPAGSMATWPAPDAAPGYGAAQPYAGPQAYAAPPAYGAPQAYAAPSAYAAPAVYGVTPSEPSTPAWSTPQPVSAPVPPSAAPVWAPAPAPNYGPDGTAPSPN